VLGGLFIGHGTQKLFGWFGGGGPEGTSEMMEDVGLHPGRLHALAAGTTEAGSGALLVAGAATPLAAAGMSGVMVTAVRRIHWKNGPWNTNGGWEYNGLILAVLAALVETGPGRLSVDAARGRVRRGSGWALAALAAGAVGSELAVRYGEKTEAERTAARLDEQPDEQELRRAA
jgi:putative oxidoreductase